MAGGSRFGLIPVFAMLLASQAARAQPVVVRDGETGRGIPARVELASLPNDIAPTAAALADVFDRTGDVRIHRIEAGARAAMPVEGRTAARVSSDGYKTLLTVIEPSTGIEGWTLWLQPARIPAVARHAAAALHGFVIDPDSLQPMKDVRVQWAGGSESAISDAQGAFSLPLPEAPADTPLVRHQLVVTAADGRRIERAAAVARGSDLRLIIDFSAAGADEPGHRHLLPADTLSQAIEAGREMQWPAGTPVEPPASVRVGYADASCSTTCCTGSCNHVCVFDLETYVRRGLNDEWIASWSTQSLRAGSVAYRSYGAWHALNPVPGRAFDICSSACCQVNDGDTSANTDLAVARTAGLMLQRNGAVFRSEYSAENNCRLGTQSCANQDLSCGNGFAGSPAANWPCLPDAVGLDRDCFGHGRGMSQWGTQRWSQPPHLQTWRWQVNHYYNQHGAGSGLRTATMTQVLALDMVRPRQRTLVPGATLVLEYNARNLASTAHERVLLGASLRRPPGPFIDDPGNDAPAVLPSGGSQHQRVFELPSGSGAGTYDVYGSLYVDIDEDGSISPDDLAQDLLLVPAALRVVANGDLIFYDGLQ